MTECYVYLKLAKQYEESNEQQVKDLSKCIDIGASQAKEVNMLTAIKISALTYS